MFLHFQSYQLASYHFTQGGEVIQKLFSDFWLYSDRIRAYNKKALTIGTIYHFHLAELEIPLIVKDQIKHPSNIFEITLYPLDQQLNILPLIQQAHLDFKKPYLSIQSNQLSEFELLDTEKQKIPKTVYAISIAKKIINANGLIHFSNGQLYTLELPNMQIPLKTSNAKQVGQSDFMAKLTPTIPNINLFEIILNLHYK
ncbi:MAG: hypothetical protein GY810_27090 [Aureispira sp.]|nr:hypothetical protein [Aureispira sp.]